MSNARAGSAVVVFLLAAFTASPTRAQTAVCPKQSATGHIEVIGSQPANFGRHIIYSFSAIQTGDVDADGACVVNGQIEEFLYAAPAPGEDPDKRGDLMRRSHGDVVCINVAADPAPQRPGQPPLLQVAHMVARITDFYPPPAAPPPEPVYWIWKVQDNGEGANDPPDYGSALNAVTGGAAANFCAHGDIRLMGPSIRGNVQVRPPDLP